MTHPTTPSALPALAGVLLAAGASRRFGAVKALHPVEGETLVARAARSLLAVCGGGVVVVTGAHDAAIRESLAGLAVRTVHHPGWAAGMGTSLAAGVRAAQDGSDPVVAGLLVMPCDLPAVGVAQLAALAAAWAREPQRVAAAGFSDTVGPPAIFPRGVWPALRQLGGDAGARGLLDVAGACSVVPMPEAALDVDTPADLPPGLRDAGA